MNRRDLMASGIAGAAAMLRGTASAADKIPVAFAGGNHSHGFAKAMICRDSPEWDLLGVWEDNAAVRKKYEDAKIRVLTREEVFAGPARVVAVESSVKDHYASALAALERGKHVHVEKPPAATLPEMRKLVDLARRKNLLLQSGYMWRYHPGFDKVIEAKRNGWLGDVYMVRGQINTTLDAAMRREVGEFKGGQMFELGAHLVDALVRLMGGAPAKIAPFIRRHGSHQDALNDNTLAVFEYPNAMAMIQSATLQPGGSAHRTFEVLGTNGTAVIRPLESPVLTIDLAAAAGPYKKGSQVVPLAPYKRYIGDLEDLAAAVRGERKLVASLDVEMDVQRTLLAASGMS